MQPLPQAFYISSLQAIKMVGVEGLGMRLVASVLTTQVPS